MSRVEHDHTDHIPEIIEARTEATYADQIAKAIAARQSRERTALYERVLGNRRQSAVTARVKNLREQATRDRRYLAQLDALSPEEAIKLIHERAAQAEAQRLAAERARQIASSRDAPHERDFRRRTNGASRDDGRRM